MTPRLALSVGCPCGVGPEVAVVAAVAEARRARVLLVGDEEAVREAAEGRRIGASRLVRVAEPDDAWRVSQGRVALWQPTPALVARDREPGRPTAASGAAQLAWIAAACDLVRGGGADAMVTGPVSKEAIAGSGARGAAGFLGHTEYLQRRLHAREVVMAFWSEALVTSLATTHLPLSRVPAAITPAVVARATYWLAWLLARLGARPARVAVAALNPHAGEGGLLGREERTRIAPGIARARERLRASRIAAQVDGPVPAETAFRLALGKRWDGVVAMYHDQATIPMKIAGFGDAVNVSLGLPIVRTSVDHGTAYDRAGTWTADAQGMRGAIVLATRLAR
ncbi:MAG TPA: 4-hydroxythreonine-4-phosphate dehydrogenase PdxA [Polyangiaceae bacterium]|jgi:4-hydroxythreonine-4-phosphate dehydrogenase